MRRRGFVIGLVLLPAAAVQAINTITTLNERSWAPAQQTLTGDIGPLNENADTVVRQTREGGSLFDNGPLPSLLFFHIRSVPFSCPLIPTDLRGGAGRRKGIHPKCR